MHTEYQLRDLSDFLNAYHGLHSWSKQYIWLQNFAQDKAGVQPAEGYDVQSTYIPPEPQYDDPFAPASSSPFVINESETTVPALASAVPSAVNSKNGPSSTVFEFHGSLRLLQKPQ